MRIDWLIGSTNTLPSPMEPVLAAPTIVALTLSTRWSGTTTSIFTLGRKSTVYSEPRYSSVCPFWRPKPRTSVTVMPITPISVSASFTSSSLKGLMIASIFFMASHLVEDGQHQGRDVAADALEVRENVEVDLGRLDRLREAGAQAADVGLAQLALAHAHEGPLVEHLLREGLVVGREGGDRALEVLGHETVELEDLGPAGLREAARLVELLARQLHEVLVDDVADVLEVADEGDEADLLARELGAHRLAPEAGQEELDLALEEVDLVVALLDLLEQRLVIGAKDGHGVAQHDLHHVGHAQRLARGLAERERGLVQRALVEVARAERRVARLIVGHDRLDRARGQRRERQEEQADAEVEERVGVGDLPRGAGGAGREHRREGADERQHEGSPQQLEGDVRDRHALGLRRRAHGRGEGRRAGADVRAEHDGHRAVEADQPLAGQRERHAEGGRRGRHERAEHGRHEDRHRRVAGHRLDQLHGQPVVPQRRHPLEDHLEAEEHEPEPEDGLTHVLERASPGQEGDREAETDEQQRVVRHLERDQLDGERGADVGAEDDAERLAEGHQPGRDEADEHQRRGRRGLDDRGHGRAGGDGDRPVARHAREQRAQAAARRALQAVAAQADAVEQQREAAEERDDDGGHGASSSDGAGAGPAAAGAPAAREARTWGAGASAPGRCAVSFSDTSRGGRTTVSEALSTRSRQSGLNEQPRSAQAYTLMTPPCATTSTSSPLGCKAPM